MHSYIKSFKSYLHEKINDLLYKIIIFQNKKNDELQFCHIFRWLLYARYYHTCATFYWNLVLEW